MKRLKRGVCQLAALWLSAAFHAGHAAEPDWHAFTWVQAELVPGTGKEKAAIVLPIKVNGIGCWAQLDTGLPSTLLWHNSPQGSPAAGATTDVQVQAAGQTLHVKAVAADLALAQSGHCTQGIVASLGNAFFERGSLTLDLQHSRLAYTPNTLLADDGAAMPFDYAHWPSNNSGGGHVVVNLRLPDGSTKQAMLDTGAASFGLSTFTPEDWSTLTAGVPLARSANVDEYEVSMWGKPITCYRSMLRGALTLGAAMALEHVQVSYCQQPYFQPGQPLVGLLGLQAFAGKVLVLDYLSRRWAIRTP